MFNIFKKKEKEKPKPTFIDLLIMSEYFEFTAKNKLEELKFKIKNNYENYQIFTTTYDDNNIPVCKKKYFCDSETLFEGWGFKSQLEYMKEGFEQITNFEKLKSQIPESYDFKSKSDSNWADAVVDFTIRINKYLFESGIKYLCYPAYGGNEGTIYLLNDRQYLLLNKVIKDDHTRPLHLSEWIHLYNPKTSEPNSTTEEKKDLLKEGIEIKHIKYGIGRIIEINDRGVANIRFKDGDMKIILKFANLEILK